MAAREQRYQWFEEMRQALQADYICVAHHDRPSQPYSRNWATWTGWHE